VPDATRRFRKFHLWFMSAYRKGPARGRARCAQRSPMARAGSLGLVPRAQRTRCQMLKQKALAPVLHHKPAHVVPGNLRFPPGACRWGFIQMDSEVAPAWSVAL
jgi:hypothetical protein